MEDNINNNQNSDKINSNSGLTFFPTEQATNSTKLTQTSSNANNIVNKDIVSRPLLWGIVVFLVFFSLVIGAVSIYRMYQADNMGEEVIVDSINTSESSTETEQADILESTPVSDDTNVEADLIEAEIQAIDSDLEEDIYSDESLGL